MSGKDLEEKKQEKDFQPEERVYLAVDHAAKLYMKVTIKGPGFTPKTYRVRDGKGRVLESDIPKEDLSKNLPKDSRLRDY